MSRLQIALVLTIAALVPAQLIAQSSDRGTTVTSEAAAAVESMVGSRPDTTPVPRPIDTFGFKAGADYNLADYSQMLEYFHALDDASERVRLETIGESVLGKPMMLAFISSEENLLALDRWRTISETLARGRATPEEARALAAEGKAVVWIDAGLHATEVAHGQMAPLLAYKVATAETAEMRRIREKTILLLMPNMNPDGLDIVVDWYERNLGTPFETAGLPTMYHVYTGHDNNRDWYMITQPETKAVARVLYREWYPQIVVNHHQSAPFPARIWVPPFAGPVNPHIPAMVVGGVNLVGAAMTERFAREGMPGAISNVGYTMWWNGGMRSAPYYHNMIGILTETAGYEYATPHYYDPEELDAGRPEIFYPDPWEGGWWRLRDAVDYIITSSMAVLDIAAERNEQWLYNMYLMARRSIERGEAGNPFAYVFSAEDQWDAGTMVDLMNVLRRGGVKVERASSDFEAGGERYGEGSYIVYAAQAFRPYLMDLLQPQHYPADKRPYDITGWTLPIQMGVTMDRVDVPFEAEARAVEKAAVIPGGVEGDGDWGWLLSHRPNASATAVNRLLESGARVSWAQRAFEHDDERRPAGTIVIRPGDAFDEDAVEQSVHALASELGLDFTGIDDRPAAPLLPLSAPRIGIYKSWDAVIDEGWTRWLLERHAFAVDTLHDRDIQEGDLAAYDAIILPSQDVEEILNGHAPGTMPEPYVGGLGVEGAAALKNYVERGGTLLALDEASEFAIQQFGLPVRNALEWADGNDFSIPGSLIAVDVDPGDPVAYGMPEDAAAFFANSRAFRIVDPASEGDVSAPAPPVEVVVRYAAENLLLSGYAEGEELLAGRPAVVRAALGRGDVVLIGFRAQFRGQPHGTFKLLFNTLHGATLERWPEMSEEVAAASGDS